MFRESHIFNFSIFGASTGCKNSCQNLILPASCWDKCLQPIDALKFEQLNMRFPEYGPEVRRNAQENIMICTTGAFNVGLDEGITVDLACMFFWLYL
jgi:hypothetical protein